MQVVHHRDLNTKEATAITARIRSKMGDLMSEVAEAWIGRAWKALGNRLLPCGGERLRGFLNDAAVAKTLERM